MSWNATGRTVPRLCREGFRGCEASCGTCTRRRSGRGAGRLAWQAEDALAEDVALDLVRPGPDGRRLVVQPGALPGPVTRIVGGVMPQRRGGPQHGHHRVVQPFAH